MFLLTSARFKGLSVKSGLGCVLWFTLEFSPTQHVVRQYPVAWWVSARPYLLKHTSTCLTLVSSFPWKPGQWVCVTDWETWMKQFYFLAGDHLYIEIKGISAKPWCSVLCCIYTVHKVQVTQFWLFTHTWHMLDMCCEHVNSSYKMYGHKSALSDICHCDRHQNTKIGIFLPKNETLFYFIHIWMHFCALVFSVFFF